MQPPLPLFGQIAFESRAGYNDAPETHPLSTSSASPSKPRTVDLPSTSHESYHRAKRSTGHVESAIVRLLDVGPMTDDSLHQAYLAARLPAVTPQRIRSARSTLTKAGRVVLVGRGLSRLGNPARIWGLAPSTAATPHEGRATR